MYSLTFNRLALVIVILVSLAQSTYAQSLWCRRHPDRVFLFADTAARRVGDLVTVIIRETTDVENRDQRALGKDSDSSFEFDVASSGNSTSSAGSFDISGNSNREFNGSSQYSVEQDFADKITVPVVEVLPNGNLVIGGRRQRLVAGEVRSLILSGIVRPIDVGPNNTVLSQYIANFKICYEGDVPRRVFRIKDGADGYSIRSGRFEPILFVD